MYLWYDKITMQIVWKGQACFYITVSRGKQEQVKILIDPFEDSLGLKLPSQDADIVLVTHNHFDHNLDFLSFGHPRIFVQLNRPAVDLAVECL